jgi:hypothetical protein
VTSVDVDRAVLAEAWEHLEGFPDRQVHLRHADGREGFAERAPYDRIMVTAATDDLEPAWLEQLAEGGLLLAPLALAPGLAYIICGTAAGGTFHGRLTRAAYFMPLRAERETGGTDVEARPFPGPLQSLPAPWAGWFDRRRPRLRWLGFTQALAFFGMLRGLRVHYRGLPNGQTIFGVSDVQGSAGCWLGQQDWQVNGASGRALGTELWRGFLDAGGPWPTEFHVRASPHDLNSVGREGFEHRGPRCRQIWELGTTRERPAWL